MNTTDEKLNDFMLKTSNQITQLQVEVKSLSELIKTSITNHATKHEVTRLELRIKEQAEDIEDLNKQMNTVWKSIATGAVGIIISIILTALDLV